MIMYIHIYIYMLFLIHMKVYICVYTSVVYDIHCKYICIYYIYVYCDVHFYFALHIDTNTYRFLKHVLWFYGIAQVMFAPSVHRQQMSLFRSISDTGG